MLYWPEKRGIYGKVEVLVINVKECDNYTVRNLVLKVRLLSCGHLHSKLLEDYISTCKFFILISISDSIETNQRMSRSKRNYNHSLMYFFVVSYY